MTLTNEQHRKRIDDVNALYAEMMKRADKSGPVALSIACQELYDARTGYQDNLEWAMRERARRINAEERLEIIRKALK